MQCEWDPSQQAFESSFASFPHRGRSTARVQIEQWSILLDALFEPQSLFGALECELERLGCMLNVNLNHPLFGWWYCVPGATKTPQSSSRSTKSSSRFAASLSPVSLVMPIFVLKSSMTKKPALEGK